MPSSEEAQRQMWQQEAEARIAKCLKWCRDTQPLDQMPLLNNLLAVLKPMQPDDYSFPLAPHLRKYQLLEICNRDHTILTFPPGTTPSIRVVGWNNLPMGRVHAGTEFRPPPTLGEVVTIGAEHDVAPWVDAIGGPEFAYPRQAMYPVLTLNTQYVVLDSKNRALGLLSWVLKLGTHVF
ncbi:hypothetical protein EIP91_008601 [Steccherinum ochraceum]|uniref:Uncharacterized protein n=1 Tax=Steccherinum ochraceum TaxID=92696 RepID=A0A4R0RS46_9APHY|nr:hypothetical protein EIP91_008601 [Steccherinum ochraceum]